MGVLAITILTDVGTSISIQSPPSITAESLIGLFDPKTGMTGCIHNIGTERLFSCRGGMALMFTGGIDN